MFCGSGRPAGACRRAIPKSRPAAGISNATPDISTRSRSTRVYRPHQRKTYERWAASTPPVFRFSVKVPKAITHDYGLADCGALLDRFLAEAGGLGDKLAILLVQLPPKMVFDQRIADAFFGELRKRSDTLVAVEPRHASWFEPATDGWLAERGLARVAADPAPVAGAEIPGGWAGLTYYRWHGLPQDPLFRLRRRRAGHIGKAAAAPSSGRRARLVHL